MLDGTEQPVIDIVIHPYLKRTGNLEQLTMFMHESIKDYIKFFLSVGQPWPATHCRSSYLVFDIFLNAGYLLLSLTVGYVIALVVSLLPAPARLGPPKDEQ